MILTINVAFLLAVVIILRLRRRVQARSRSDEKLTVGIVLIFGLLIAPTDFGQGLRSAVEEVVHSLSQSGTL